MFLFCDFSAFAHEKGPKNHGPGGSVPEIWASQAPEEFSHLLGSMCQKFRGFANHHGEKMRETPNEGSNRTVNLIWFPRSSQNKIFRECLTDHPPLFLRSFWWYPISCFLLAMGWFRLLLRNHKEVLVLPDVSDHISYPQCYWSFTLTTYFFATESLPSLALYLHACLMQPTNEVGFMFKPKTGEHCCVSLGVSESAAPKPMVDWCGCFPRVFLSSFWKSKPCEKQSILFFSSSFNLISSNKSSLNMIGWCSHHGSYVDLIHLSSGKQTWKTGKSPFIEMFFLSKMVIWWSHLPPKHGSLNLRWKENVRDREVWTNIWRFLAAEKNRGKWSPFNVTPIYVFRRIQRLFQVIQASDRSVSWILVGMSQWTPRTTKTHWVHCPS